MCEFCHEHGEGKKWYLQAKNYSEELWNEERKTMTREFFRTFEENVVGIFSMVDEMRAADPATVEAMLPSIVEEQKERHWGQVVPMEEIEQIIDMTVEVVRLPCACRSATRGLYDARFCFGIAMFQGGMNPTEFPDWATDFEVMTKENAKRAIRRHDHNGLVHSIWTFISPYIAGICNCAESDCLAMRGRLRSGFGVAFPFFKAEYVARIDWEECNGCRDCKKVCQFGAISYSPSLAKCYINQYQCYGCGVCRAVCPKDAIELKDRNAIPALVGEW